jgi:RHS repeat-associated protein
LAAQLGQSGGIQELWSLTARGELGRATAKKVSDNTQLAGLNRAWLFDTRGNRTEQTVGGTHNDNGTITGGTVTAFTADNLDRYTAIGGINRNYDVDGNLRGDGAWTYEWDGENRLKAAENAAHTQRLEFTDDYLGRRVRKIVKTGTGGGGFSVASDRKFIYDGWNVIAELDNLQTGLPVVRTFAWGLDLTGTVHGGGGVGGLLRIGEGTASRLPVYDGNGTVHGLLDGISGAFVAAYSYSASGEIVQEAGSAAADNPIRFASKWYDTETALCQYNHRYYSPAEGRFINRDPIGENGGLNLYAYCGSHPAGGWDALGLDDDVEVILPYGPPVVGPSLSADDVRYDVGGAKSSVSMVIPGSGTGPGSGFGRRALTGAGDPDPRIWVWVNLDFPTEEVPYLSDDGDGSVRLGAKPEDDWDPATTIVVLPPFNTDAPSLNVSPFITIITRDELLFWGYLHGMVDMEDLTGAPNSETKPKFDRPIDPKRDTDTYNCAGLCFRDYTYKSKSDTLKLLATGVKVEKGNKTVSDERPLVVVYYNIKGIELVDQSGRVVHRQAIDDFHVVGSLRGADNAASKNGQSPIEGPGPVDSFPPNQPYPPRTLPPGIQLRPIYTEQWYHLPYKE